MSGTTEVVGFEPTEAINLGRFQGVCHKPDSTTLPFIKYRLSIRDSQASFERFELPTHRSVAYCSIQTELKGQGEGPEI